MDGQQLTQDPFAPIDPSEDPGEQLDESSMYWATRAELAPELMKKEEAYFESARNRGLLVLWVVAYAAHHGLTPDDLRDFSTQQIGFQGNELEQIRFHLNLVRPYVRHQTSLALGEPAAFQAMVANSDHKSLSKAEFVDQAINSLYKRYSEQYDQEAAEGDGVFGFGGTHYRWDFLAGDDMQVPGQVQVDSGEMVDHVVTKKSGAPVVTVVYPWTVFHEPRVSGEHQWMCVREIDSKWNLIAQFPDMRDQIMNANAGDADRYDFGTLFRLEELHFASSDMVTVKHFYHRRCAAVPEGRYAIIYGDVILWDGPCPRRDGVPIAQMRSGRFIESTFGYADSWDLIAIVQALNQVNSDEMQNYATFGRQSIAIEKGTEVTVDDIARGNTAFFVPPGAAMPKAVQLAAVPSTLPNLKDYLHKMLDTVSGQNAASRGDPDPNVRSGEMNALLDSIAIRYQSFRQAAARRFRIEGATILLDMITRYGETPFLVDIAGIENRSYVAEFTREDLSGVRRVTMEQVSPLIQSTAGRLQLVTTLRDLPPDDRAAAYEMVTTGNTTRWLRTDRTCEMLIRKENEDLVTGARQVSVTGGDNPFRHYPLHYAMREQLMSADMPDVEAISRLDQHLLEHVQVYLGMSPLVAGMLQIPPPPPLQPNNDNPFGNPAWQFQMLTGGGMGPGQGPGPGMSEGGGGTPQKPPQEASAQQAQAQDSGSAGQQVHPSGTNLPSPSSPPPSSPG